MAKELNDQASALESNWGPDGTMRVLAHTIVGGMTGGLAGAAGAAAGTLTAPNVASALDKAGVDPELAKALTGLSSTLVGAAVGGAAGGAAAYNEVANNFLKHADAAALKKEIEACSKKTGGCSDGDVTSIFKKYKEISDQNIAAVQSCIIAGDVACVQKNLSEAASVSEVKVLPFGYTKLEDTLIGRQANVISYGSVMGNASLMGTDIDQAREVANFRTDNCGGLSVAACDGLVRDAINYRLLRMATLSAVAAATPALVGEARKLVVPKEKPPTVVPDRDRYTADQDLPNVYSNQEVAKNYFGQERKYWNAEPVKILGNVVYQRNDLIDPDRVDSKTGKTNVELMQAGRAPIGADGNPINLHHMLQSQDGPIAEVTQTFHQQNYSAIHINAGSDIPSGINRSEFNTWRSNYWKNRANDFK